MPIQIDHFDSELEILPERPAARRRAAPTGIASTPESRREQRRQVVAVLEDALQSYLRSRG